MKWHTTVWPLIARATELASLGAMIATICLPHSIDKLHLKVYHLHRFHCNEHSLILYDSLQRYDWSGHLSTVKLYVVADVREKALQYSEGDVCILIFQ